MFSEMKLQLAIAFSAFFLFLIFSSAPAPAKTTPQESRANAELTKFERQLWSGAPVTKKDFAQIFSGLNNAIASELSSDTVDTERALFYLEKLKNFRLIEIYRSSDLFTSRLEKFHGFLAQTYKLNAAWSNLINTKKDLPIADQKNLTKKFQLLFAAAIDSARKIDPLLINFLVWQKPISTRQIQAQLDSREMILDYWLHNGDVAVFYISADSVGVRKWHIDPARFSDALFSFDSTLFSQTDVLDLHFDEQNGFSLYRQLIQPLEKTVDEYSRLDIIPDASFWGLPLECLLSKKGENVQKSNILYKKYQNMHFLIKRFSISYNFSLSALDPALLNLRPQTKLGRRLLTMSEPVFPAKDGSLADALPPMLWLDHSPNVNDEIRRVSRLLFRHDNLRGNEATTQFLNQRAGEYRWIYLAQLGLLNNDQPLRSGLMMSADQNDSEDENYWLTVSDLFHVPFRADMVTLSATIFYPKVTKNSCPGILTLPQAFLLAGNKSVLYSLWHVHSVSTSEFMSKFYWELKYKRQHNTLALRGAKLASMNDTFDFLDQKISRAHPYFWAGFRLIGSPYVSSPSNAKIPPWGVVIIAYAVLLIAGGLITRKTLSKK